MFGGVFPPMRKLRQETVPTWEPPHFLGRLSASPAEEIAILFLSNAELLQGGLRAPTVTECVQFLYAHVRDDHTAGKRESLDITVPIGNPTIVAICR